MTSSHCIIRLVALLSLDHKMKISICLLNNSNYGFRFVSHNCFALTAKDKTTVITIPASGGSLNLQLLVRTAVGETSEQPDGKTVNYYGI